MTTTMELPPKCLIHLRKNSSATTYERKRFYFTGMSYKLVLIMLMLAYATMGCDSFKCFFPRKKYSNDSYETATTTNTITNTGKPHTICEIRKRSCKVLCLNNDFPEVCANYCVRFRGCLELPSYLLSER
ncbi:unnamed protein product [Cylicocyclus nassatus]|uniref:Uncharacterized protein n=1 Tax=Cylicocyclus nassatus TaxID=53992 RepID=A0AA36DUF3_CYLNA|nr:unnamed protein product [Cylicocyclus nassatus]